ncbi:MAG: ligase-associated DNA damage response endonuclease PdeM [Phycisphaerae bacterium]|nr:ligase-associated DNA damage response endonuclease PdeM [Phycisphaerae bacterium]
MPAIDGSIFIEHGSARLQLLPDKAIYFPACNTLIIADVHAGKGTAFRAAGVPVPVGSSQKDLQRIGRLLVLTRAERLVILGDFLHHKSSRDEETMACVARWRDAHSQTRMLLVRGNHDRTSGRLPGEWNIAEVEDPFDEGCGIIFAHQPRDGGDVPVLCGHVHPVVSVRDFDRSTIRVPCFWFDHRNCGVLPSFGSLTGGYNVGQHESDRIYLVLGKNVVPAEKLNGRLADAG